MANSSPWKIGVGVGAILLGIYLAFNQKDTISIIVGIAAIAFGIGLIASN